MRYKNMLLQTKSQAQATIKHVKPRSLGSYHSSSLIHAMTEYVTVPLNDNLPDYVKGRQICRILDLTVDYNQEAAHKDKPTTLGNSKNSKASDFSFGKALQGIKSSQGDSACNARGDGSFANGANIKQQGNVVYLSPNALQEDNAEQTLQQLDQLTSNQTASNSSNSTDSRGPDIQGLANLLSQPSTKQPPIRRTRYEDVQAAGRGLLDDVDDDGNKSYTQHTAQQDNSQQFTSQANDRSRSQQPLDARSKGQTGTSLPTLNHQWQDATVQGLSQPKFSLVQHDSQQGPTCASYELILELPNVSGPDEVEVDIDPTCVNISIPEKYLPLQVPLMKPVDTANSKAKWSRKDKRLVLTLPCA